MLKLAILDGRPEVFYTLQGEGVSVGTPAVFIRLSLCNLQCVWCDTPYTWLWDDSTPHNTAKPFDPKKEIIEVEIEQILDEVGKYPQCDTVVITGGEPLLQQKKLAKLTERLKLWDKRIEVETNGTIVPVEIDQWVTQYNVSPKLQSSGNADEKRDIAEAMVFFTRSEKAWFKFVITSRGDLSEVLILVEKYTIPRSKVILMPEGVTEQEIRSKEQWLQEFCENHGFRFCTRLHILLYGSKRGT